MSHDFEDQSAQLLPSPDQNEGFGRVAGSGRVHCGNLHGQPGGRYRGVSGLLKAIIHFDGTIINKQHIGKTSEQVIALWNAEQPDDPVVE
ncbi:MAG: hypothetical protein ACOYY3_13565 [Chloroflexota bacterium]